MLQVRRIYDNRESRYVGEVGCKDEAVEIIRRDYKRHKCKHGAGYMVFGARWYDATLICFNEKEAAEL